MLDRWESDNRWDWSDLDSLREEFFADSPQPQDAAGWLVAEHRFAEHLANSTMQWSPHWDNFDMDGELRDRENAGTVLKLGHPQDRAFIAYQDSAAVLRRVVFEREILAEHAPGDMARERDETECRTCSEPQLGFSGMWAAEFPCRTVLGLAAAWGWEGPK